MAIKIGSTTVITNNLELDARSGYIVFNPKSSLPSSGNTNGDTLYLSTINSLVTYFNGLWISQLGVVATGGNSTETSNGRKYHIFTSPGTFSVVAKPSDSVKDLDVFMIGGGGGGGRQGGGGGGAGQARTFDIDGSYFTPGNNNTCTVTVGSGGSGCRVNPSVGSNGGDTSLNFSGVSSTLIAVGGGGGGALNTDDPTSRTAIAGQPGASGGGGGAGFRQSRPGGSNTVPTGRSGGSGAYSYDSRFSGGGGGSPQGNGSGASPSSSGGVGAIAEGIDGLPPQVGTPGPNASRRYFAGGGCGTGWSSARSRPTYGGAGGSTGSGNVFPQPEMDLQLPATNALDNTGSGGGGRSWRSADSGYSNGGSGIVVLSYIE